MKKSVTLLTTIFLFYTAVSVGQKLPALKVEKGNRYLEQTNGKPFFWLGDTAWELMHRLTLKEAEFYLKTRAAQGYNVIQTIAFADFDGLHLPNQNGDQPLFNNDPTKPNEKYFRHVDQVIAIAEKLGIYIALLPAWGDRFNKKTDPGPEIFTPENAAIYAHYLAKRYQNKNVIWILGGDRNPDSDRHLAIINAMADAIRKVSGKSQLITYHPQGLSFSSKFFHESDWLDVNMFQSGHDLKNRKNYEMLKNDYDKQPIKPTLDAEPRYEDHPINWKPELGYFNEFDVRQAAYWSVFSGACGHTYGCHDIWQMFDPAKHQTIASARTTWQVAVNLPGARQMGYMRKLLESHPWWKLEPTQSLILNKNTEDAGFQVAALSKDKDFMMVYTPFGREINVDLSKLKSSDLIAYWFNPRDCTSIKIGTFKNTGTQIFKPYAQGPETDWVLVVDDSAKNWSDNIFAK